MKDSQRLLLQNKAWATEKRLIDPTFFERTSTGQSPKFLWIGCSDSRVPADVVIGAQPGEIFVHRNIANLALQNDVNVMSVVNYAVEVLKVSNIIVCGHQGCGGVRAAMTSQDFGALNPWLANIKKVHEDHRADIDALAEARAREDLLVSLNARAQLRNLMQTDVVQRAWGERNGPALHAWVYRLCDGVLEVAETIAPGMPVASTEEIHRRAAASRRSMAYP